MPYITPNRRAELEPLSGALPVNAGELNFQICCLLKQYLAAHKTRYQTLNDILGAMDGALTEFKRRVLYPYENRKIQDNGDIW